jgi:hypothetical protein
LENVTVVYTGIGVAELYYTPPLNWEGTVHIAATQNVLIASCEIKVGATDPSGDLTVAANPNTVMKGFASTITATLVEGPVGAKTPVVGQDIIFSLAPTPPSGTTLGGTFRKIGLATPYSVTVTETTDAQGIASVIYKSSKIGIETIVATTTNATANCPVTVTALDETNRYTYVFEMISFSGEILNQTLIDNGALSVRDTGAAIASTITADMVQVLSGKYMPMVSLSRTGILNGIDVWGGTDRNPEDIEEKVTLAVFIPFLPIGYTSYKWTVKISGGNGAKIVTAHGDAPPNNYWFSPLISQFIYIDLFMPWVENKVEIKVPVTTGEGSAIKNTDGTATAAGQTQPINKDTGEATFTDLPPGTHDITLNVSGFYNNQPPKEFSPYANWDTNPDNKTIEIADRSTRAFRLKATPFTVQATVEVYSSEKHTWATASSGSYGYSVVSVKDNLLGMTQGSTVASTVASTEEGAPP